MSRQQKREQVVFDLALAIANKNPNVQTYFDLAKSLGVPESILAVFEAARVEKK